MKKKVIAFSFAFVLLQVIDLWLTSIALKDPGNSEANPLYFQGWFVYVKLGMIMVIAPMLYYCLNKAPKLGNIGMYGIIAMYVLICLNNAVVVII